MNAVRNYMSRAHSAWDALTNPTTVEIARQESVGYQARDADGRRSSQFFTNEPMDPSPELIEFRLLLGIWQDKSFRAPQGFNPSHRPVVSSSHRPAPNMGIYPTVYDNEIKCKRSYKIFATLISTCLGLQVVVAGALTALGASNGSHKAVTVFGAINIVIAGFLTWLKGSGLPNRLKYFQHEWGKVREYIEQRERDFSCLHGHISVHDEVNIIRKMYEEVRADIENNTPDRFVSAGQLRREPLTTAPGPPIASLHIPNQSDAHKVSDGLLNGIMSVKSKADEKERDVVDLEKGMESYGKEWFQDKETQAFTAMNRAQHFGSGVFNDVQGLQSQLEQKNSRDRSS